MKTRLDKKSKEKKPVILQVLPELETGGVERGAVEIARGLVKQGYGALVASGGGYLEQQVVSAGANHILLPLASKNPLTMYFNVRRLEQIIREYNVDIVHARSRAPAWSAYFAARRAGVKFMTTFHGFHSIGNGLKRRYNAIMARGEKVICISDFIKQHILAEYKTDEKKLEVVHRGVDLDMFDPKKVSAQRKLQIIDTHRIPEDKSVIMLPGRITGWKGHEFLLDALALMKDEDFLCLFVGTDSKHPSHRKRLEHKIVSLGLAGKVRIIGNVKDMPAMYSLADVVVSSSIRPEAFGRVAVEAQAMGRLVVATDHGGARETVVDGKTGWLVAREPEAMATALQKAITLNARTRAGMNKAAIKHVKENFALEKMVVGTLNVYEQLLSPKKRLSANNNKQVKEQASVVKPKTKPKAKTGAVKQAETKKKAVKKPAKKTTTKRSGKA